MPATAYLTWSGDSASESSDGAKTTQGRGQKWQIVDAPDHASAMNAIGLPKINQELTPGSPFRVRSRTPRKVGPRTWEADVQYGIPENGGYTTPDPDPKNRPKVITWGESRTSFPMDQDARKRLVRNSAGDVFDPLPTQERVVETLQIEWATDIYDRATARKYRNKVNSDQFVVDSTTIYPRECLCTGYRPAAGYSVGTNTIQMIATFELATDSRADDESTDSGFPYDAHLVDQGTNGWYIHSPGDGKLKKGYFCTTTSEGGVDRVLSIITAPILLNGLGQPLAVTGSGSPAPIKITDRSDGSGHVFEPVPAPAAFQMRKSGPLGSLDNDQSPFSTPNPTPSFVWLFRNHKAVPFAGIA